MSVWFLSPSLVSCSSPSLVPRPSLPCYVSCPSLSPSSVLWVSSVCITVRVSHISCFSLTVSMFSCASLVSSVDCVQPCFPGVFSLPWIPHVFVVLCDLSHSLLCVLPACLVRVLSCLLFVLLDFTNKAEVWV